MTGIFGYLPVFTGIPDADTAVAALVAGTVTTVGYLFVATALMSKREGCYPRAAVLFVCAFTCWWPMGVVFLLGPAGSHRTMAAVIAAVVSVVLIGVIRRLAFHWGLWGQ